uniref:30S ribosomal protein S9 n=1 Tax=Anthurium amnicola TaxID=1678845 RepID=A0A1D1Y462_9ARAE
MFPRFLSRPLLLVRHLVLTPPLSSSSSLSPPRWPTSALPLVPVSTWGRPLLGQCPRVAFSSKRKDGGDRDDGSAEGSWKLTLDNEDDVEDLFAQPDADDAGGVFGFDGVDSWPEGKKGDISQGIDRDFLTASGGGDDAWETAEGYKPWGFEEDEGKGEAFRFGAEQGGLEGLRGGEMVDAGKMTAEQLQQLTMEEEQELLTTSKGPNRVFGDLIATSGITEEMIDSLILLKDLRGPQGLPPSRENEDAHLGRDDAPSVRNEMERKKQKEVAKVRVRQVDEKGRAYGTGRRKCSIARVWIQPGDGNFTVNDKQFDAYFPIIDHRADLLRPFTATKTLGLFDVNCTVKGGGVSGQVGAVRLGISNALQNFEPGLRENLKSVGFLTRDPRVVERKKPGKAKARKSFQWVKR